MLRVAIHNYCFSISVCSRVVVWLSRVCYVAPIIGSDHIVIQHEAPVPEPRQSSFTAFGWERNNTSMGDTLSHY
jgi:hypothetical protein